MLNLKWVVAGIIVIGIIYLYVRGTRTSVDGFQSTATTGSTPMQTEVCGIIKELQTSLQYKYDNFDQTKLSPDTKAVLEISLAAVAKQMKDQGC